MADGTLIFDTKIDSNNFNKDIKKLTNKSNELTQKMTELANKKIPTTEFVEVQKQIDETTRRLNILIDRKQKIEDLGVNKLSKQWKSLQYDINATTRVLDEAKTEMNELNLNGGSYIDGKKTQEYKELQNELDITTKKMNNLKNASNIIQNNNQVENQKRNLTSIEKSINRISRRIASMMAYKMINASINAMKESFQDVAKYSNDFNFSVSNIQSSFIQAKNSIATAFIPVLQALEPIIVRVSNAFSEFATSVAMYTTALFTNNKTYIRAKKVTTDYAKSLGQVDKAQQKLLANFDEIEILSETKSAGSSYGLSPSAQFEEVAIPENVLDNVEKFKEKWAELEPYIKAIGIALAGLAIGAEIIKLIDWINKLNGVKNATDLLNNSMLSKNDILGQQTTQTAKETSALWSLIPALLGAGAGVMTLKEAMKKSTQIDFKMPETAPVYAFGEATVQTAETVKTSMNEIDTSTEETSNSVGETLEGTAGEFETFSDDVHTTLDTLYTNEEQNSLEFVNVLKKNFDLLNKEPYESFLSWGRKIGMVSYTVFKAIADNSKEGLETTNKNSNGFIENTSTGFVKWGENITKNCATTMQGWYKTFTSALSSAWDSFVDFMAGIGESISNWWSGAKEWVIPTLAIGIPIAGLAAAPFTGGSSLAFCALANGTVVPANYGEFGAILGDNKREPEIVSPLSTMKQALLEALSESGQNITIKFEETSIGDLVRVLKPYIDKENRRIGNSTRVTGGAY